MITHSLSTRRANPGQSDSPVKSWLLQRKCDQCRKKRQLLQRSALKNSSVEEKGPNSAPPIVHEVLRSPGAPLDDTARAFMEPRFGQDFSQVRVHTGAKASESAKAVDALAYTVGQDVVFKEGQYNPRVAGGKALLAHELAHVGQQEAAPVSGPLYIADLGSPTERQATDSASRALNTGQANVRTGLRTSAHVARQRGAGTGTQASQTPARSNHVNVIRVSCESNTIEFDTDTGVHVYGLTKCDIEDADYMATVTIDGKNVNFSPPPDSPGANARFPYRIQPGQPNPSTFLKDQTTVHIVTAKLVPPTPSKSATPFKVCARKLQISPVGNHAYIEAPPFRYAIISPTCPAHWYNNPVTGTGGQKWDNSPDPCGKTPTCLDCIPAPGVTDVGRCLRDAFSSYNNPSLYRLSGPNSNTFAGTLARKCCAGMVPRPAALGWVPGWDDSPAPARPAPSKGCPPGPTC
jgi:hypothetical protein